MFLCEFDSNGISIDEAFTVAEMCSVLGGDGPFNKSLIALTIEQTPRDPGEESFAGTANPQNQGTDTAEDSTR